ncbi:hypothetical protein R6Z07M_007345 [Ovis aries]
MVEAGRMREGTRLSFFSSRASHEMFLEQARKRRANPKRGEPANDRRMLNPERQLLPAAQETEPYGILRNTKNWKSAKHLDFCLYLMFYHHRCRFDSESDLVPQEVKPTGSLEPLFAGGMERFYGASRSEEHRKWTLRTLVGCQL